MKQRLGVRGVLFLMPGLLFMVACSQPTPPGLATATTPAQNRTPVSNTPIPQQARPSVPPPAASQVPSSTPVFADLTFTLFVISTLPAFAKVALATPSPGERTANTPVTSPTMSSQPVARAQSVAVPATPSPVFSDKPAPTATPIATTPASFVFRENQIQHPTWSSDGSSVVFDNAHFETPPSTGQPCRQQLTQTSRTLGIYHLATRICTDIPSDPQSANSSWLADGIHLLYRGLDGLSQTSLQRKSQVLYSNANIDSPVLDSTGNRVAMMLRASNEWDIVTANSDGSGLVRLTGPSQTAQRVNNVAPAWSPDGRSILYLSDRTGSWQPYIMAADGANPRLLFPGGLPGISFKYGYAAERIFSWTR